MENEIKALPLKCEWGEEQVVVRVDSYIATRGLYIELLHKDGKSYEPFADMTVCIPEYSLEPNEAFINGDMSREYLQLIKEHSLGKILPYRVQSGFRQYTPVVFDLDKLQELDSEGVKRFKQEHDIPNRQPRTNKYEHER